MCHQLYENTAERSISRIPGREAPNDRRVSWDSDVIFASDDLSPLNETDDRDNQREVLRHTSSFREGKFREIIQFMTVPDNYRNRELLCRPANQTSDLKPGKIIYVSDDPTSDIQTRLDRRVMLVLRIRPTSVTCLSFCQHYPEPADPADHWRVCAKGSTPEAGDNDGIASLQIILRPYGPTTTTAFSPQPNTTINVQDMWNVETGVRVAMLGYIDPDSMRALVKEVKKLFSASLDLAVPPKTDGEGQRTNHSKGQGKSRSPPNKNFFFGQPSVKKSKGKE